MTDQQDLHVDKGKEEDVMPPLENNNEHQNPMIRDNINYDDVLENIIKSIRRDAKQLEACLLNQAEAHQRDVKRGVHLYSFHLKEGSNLTDRSVCYEGKYGFMTENDEQWAMLVEKHGVEKLLDGFDIEKHVIIDVTYADVVNNFNCYTGQRYDMNVFKVPLNIDGVTPPSINNVLENVHVPPTNEPVSQSTKLESSTIEEVE
jgi:hypothetical protein